VDAGAAVAAAGVQAEAVTTSFLASMRSSPRPAIPSGPGALQRGRGVLDVHRTFPPAPRATTMSSSEMKCDRLVHVAKAARYTEGSFRAGVVKLADARDSKSRSLRGVWVRFPPPAPIRINHLRLILDRVNGAGRWPCGARLWDVGGEPEVSQDSLDHLRLVNQRHEPQPPPAAARSKSA
jgi:hypothetical protein